MLCHVPIVLALLLVAALAPAAEARVRVSAERVVVDAGDARAVIERDTVRIAFQTAAGRTVLCQVGGPRRARRIPPTEDPEPFALERRPDRAVYAPLTF